MRSVEHVKNNETALQKRLRHCSVTCHIVADLIAECGEDEEAARAIGRRVMTGVSWVCTGTNSDKPSEERQAVQQRTISAQFVGYLMGQATNKEDAAEIGALFLRGIDWVWGAQAQRELRVVC
jgi:hypothetical protein